MCIRDSLSYEKFEEARLNFNYYEPNLSRETAGQKSASRQKECENMNTWIQKQKEKRKRRSSSENINTSEITHKGKDHPTEIGIENAQLKKKLSEYMRRVEEAQTQNQALRQQLQKQQTERNKDKKVIADLKNKISALRDRITTLEGTQNESRASIVRAYEYKIEVIQKELTESNTQKTECYG